MLQQSVDNISKWIVRRDGRKDVEESEWQDCDGTWKKGEDNTNEDRR